VRVAAGNEPDALRAATQALRTFRGAYRKAFEALRVGAAATFPAGTFLLKRLFNVQCEPPDTPWCLRFAA